MLDLSSGRGLTGLKISAETQISSLPKQENRHKGGIMEYQEPLI
jgi:hypothetical protein